MDTQSKTKLRRRLLKGGLAGPAVFTIASGTAWAQSVTCLENNPRPGQLGRNGERFPAVKLQTADEWMRKPVTSFNLGGSTAVQTLGARTQGSRFVLGQNGEYMELVERRLRRVEGPLVGVTTRETNLKPGFGITEENRRTDLVLVAYDLNGDEIMYFGDAFPGQGYIARASGLVDGTPACVRSVQLRRRNIG